MVQSWPDFFLCIALNMGNLDQLKFLSYLVQFLSDAFYIFNSVCQQYNDLFRKYKN